MIPHTVCSDEARRDAVDAGKLDPFHSQRLGQVRHGGLAGIVGGLGLGDVDEDARHAAGEDDARAPVAARLLLALEHLGGGLRGPEGAVEVDVEHLPPLVLVVVDGGDVRRDARVGHADVELPAAQLAGNLLHRGRDVVLGFHVAAVGLDGRAVGRLGDLRGDGVGLAAVRARVGDGHLGACFCETLGHFQADSAASAGDDGGLSSQAEVGQHWGLGIGVSSEHHVGRFE